MSNNYNNYQDDFNRKNFYDALEERNNNIKKWDDDGI